MKSGIYGATKEAQEKIKSGYNPFKKKKSGGGCTSKGCPPREPEKKEGDNK